MHPAPHTGIPASRASRGDPVPQQRPAADSNGVTGASRATRSTASTAFRVDGGAEDHRRAHAALRRAFSCCSSAASGTASSARSTASGSAVEAG